MRTSVIIPNFNGGKLLEKNLPKVLAEGVEEVIVVDDGSTDGSRDVLQKFKEVKVFRNEKNLGFVNSINKGVVEAAGKVIVLLNNDVAPSKNFLKPVMPYFENQKIFAVTFAEPQFSWAKATFADGFIVHSPGQRLSKPHISFWASGGSAAFSREKWQTLGGMDPLYHPFYWEDIDLSYRAAKRGWEIWWEPASVVHHAHGETISKYFSKSYIDYTSARNQFIFIWKNITSHNLIREHYRELFKRLLRGDQVKPFLGALIKMPKIIPKRNIEKKESKVTDEEIFSKFT